MTTAGSSNADSFSQFKEIFDEPLTNWTPKIVQKELKNGYKLSIHQRKSPNGGTDMLRVDAVFTGIKR